MDPTKQSGLLETAEKHFVSDFGSPEAEKGRDLTSALDKLRLETGTPGEWFDASTHNGRKVATRITKTTYNEDSDSLTPSKNYDIEVGITSESGSMGADDLDLMVITWAHIEFNVTADGIRFPNVFTLGDDAMHDVAENEVHPDSREWGEIQFTVDRAFLVDKTNT